MLTVMMIIIIMMMIMMMMIMMMVMMMICLSLRLLQSVTVCLFFRLSNCLAGSLTRSLALSPSLYVSMISLFLPRGPSLSLSLSPFLCLPHSLLFDVFSVFVFFLSLSLSLSLALPSSLTASPPSSLALHPEIVPVGEFGAQIARLLCSLLFLSSLLCCVHLFVTGWCRRYA